MSIPPAGPSTLDRDDILRTAYLPHREATGPTGSMFPEASARLPANRGSLIPRTGFEPLASNSPRGYRPLLPKPATVTAPVVVTPQNQNQNQNSYVHTQARPPPPPTIMPRYSSSEFSFTPPSQRPPPPAWPGTVTTSVINPPLPLPLPPSQQNHLPTSTVTPSRGHRRPQAAPPWWLHPQYQQQQQQQQPPPICPSRGHLPPPRNSWCHGTSTMPTPRPQTQTQTQIQHYQPATAATAAPAAPTVTRPWPPAPLNANGKRPAATVPVPVQIQIQAAPPGHHHAHHAPRSGSGSGSSHPRPLPSTLKSPVKKKPRTRTGIPPGVPSREAVRHALLNPHLSASGSLLGKCLREFGWGRKEAVDYAVGGGDAEHGTAQPWPHPTGSGNLITPKSSGLPAANSAQVQPPPPSQAACLPTVIAGEYGGQASTSNHNGVQTVNPADLQLQLEEGPMMLSDEEVMFITAYRESMAVKHREYVYTPPSGSASLTPDDSGVEAEVNPGNDSSLSLAHYILDSAFDHDNDNSSLDRDCGWPPNPDPIAEELGLQMPPLALALAVRGRGDVFGEDLFGAVPWSPLDDGDGDVDLDVDLDLDMEWELDDDERFGLGKGKGKGKVGMGRGG